MWLLLVHLVLLGIIVPLRTLLYIPIFVLLVGAPKELSQDIWCTFVMSPTGQFTVMSCKVMQYQLLSAPRCTLWDTKYNLVQHNSALSDFIKSLIVLV